MLALPWLRQSVAGFSPWWTEFSPRVFHVGFMVNKVAVGPVFLPAFQFPCQYHSTNAPYSFIHLPRTLYNVCLPALQFPLSISFHQCSILIHSSTTNAVCFSPSTSVSPVSIITPMLHTHSFIYHQRCIMFFSQHFSFPCQYHYTNATYSFVNLPRRVYNIFLPVLHFPLSISLIECVEFGP